jgi:hypothetical protein
MNSTKLQGLESVIAAIQKKWGANAIRKASDQQVPHYLSTGYPTLDTFVDGGLLRGGITEIVGQPTSGMTTLALKIMAMAQSQGDGVVYIDLASAFDPASARYCGVNISDLMLIRDDFESAAALLYDIIITSNVGVLVFNSLPKLSSQQHLALAKTLNRLMPFLTHSHCVLLFLTLADSTPSSISQYANLRLLTTFDRWLLADNDVQGYQTVITVLKYKSGIEGRKIPLQIMFDEKTTGGEA